MYRAYVNECERKDQNFGYPNYGYGYSNYNKPNQSLVNKSNGKPKTWTYGENRRFPFSWARDQVRKDKAAKRGKDGKRPGKHDKGDKGDKEDKGDKGDKEDKGDKDSPRSPPTPPPPPPPPPTPPPKEELAKMLCVKNIDLHVKENTEKHKTDLFECTDDGQELVLRRGDSFLMTIDFNRPFDKTKYDCMLGFSIGENPNAIRGSKVEIVVDETGKEKFNPDQWGANLRGKGDSNKLKLEVHIPVNCIIGEWNIRITTSYVFDDKEREPEEFVYVAYEDFTVLFNPWCKDDTVYMPTVELLKEYILNDSGCVYRGSQMSSFGKPWLFGQFEDGILEAALYIMRKGFKTSNDKALSNPVKVSRMIAKMVNSCDDNGVLTGNWSGDYEGGTSPTKWSGSGNIFNQYMETCEPVQFGQCWVFSCLTTTVCRALGIPCRTVTNFASAHDTDGSCTIDTIYSKDDEGALIKENSGDSVWNFHVWNEVWMARPDLECKREFDGWQVIDATPQEHSDGVFQCGPCPVSAIRRGLVNVGYDTPFVFAEVNADRITWKRKHGQLERMSITTRSVGLNISTKVPDGKKYTFNKLKTDAERRKYSNANRLDITHEYKHPEGSEQERVAVMKAHELVDHKRPGAYSDVVIHPIKFTLGHEPQILNGEKLEIHLRGVNHGTVGRVAKVTITVAPQWYTGVEGKPFCTKNFGDVSIAEDSGQWFSLNITPADYREHIGKEANLKIEASISVPQCQDQKEFELIKSHEVILTVPDLDIEGPEMTKKGESATFVVSFKNPLEVPLTKCDVSMESTGFKNINDQAVDDIPVDGTFEQKFTAVAKKKGDCSVAFNFDCKEMRTLNGSQSVFVVPS